MDPRNFRTWSSFGDHPILTRRDAVSEWSSNPTIYDEEKHGPAFDVRWYVHVDPPLPIEVQAELAARDLKNLVDVCEELEERFGPFAHELFILDDLTVYVSVECDGVGFEIFPQHANTDVILALSFEHPVEADYFDLTSIKQVIPYVDLIKAHGANKTALVRSAAEFLRASGRDAEGRLAFESIVVPAEGQYVAWFGAEEVGASMGVFFEGLTPIVVKSSDELSSHPSD